MAPQNPSKKNAQNIDRKTNTVDFGFTSVTPQEKSKKVEAVFNSVSKKYDLMNDLMSLGLHRLWKQYTLSCAQIKPQHRVLDLAAGTGDLSLLIAKRITPPGCIVLMDSNLNMLKQAKAKLLNAHTQYHQYTRYIQANAESMPCTKNYFDRVLISFGLRNITDKAKALSEMYRVLKPGCSLIILEFSKPALPLLSRLYDFYSFNILPKLGQWVVGDTHSYQYLVESIRKHPDQNTLVDMMQTTGFSNCGYNNLMGGIVAVHKGFKVI